MVQSAISRQVALELQEEVVYLEALHHRKVVAYPQVGVAAFHQVVVGASLQVGAAAFHQLAEAVAVAALRALGTLGRASSLPILLKAAAGSDSPAADAALASGGVESCEILGVFNVGLLLHAVHGVTPVTRWHGEP